MKLESNLLIIFAITTCTVLAATPTPIHRASRNYHNVGSVSLNHKATYDANVDIVGCETYSPNKSTDGCLSCYFGYAKVLISGSNYGCEKCPAGCQTCSTPDSCTKCYTGYF